ncbi:MAG TPA: hypothetical protein VFR16_15630 [Agromyces mariniharenae]|nr:hypothetical protein [Agromyces mariniharenae]
MAIRGAFIAMAGLGFGVVSVIEVVRGNWHPVSLAIGPAFFIIGGALSFVTWVGRTKAAVRREAASRMMARRFNE